MIIKYFGPKILALAKRGDAGFDLTASAEPTFGGAKSYSTLREGSIPVTNFLSLDYIEYNTGVIWDPPEENLVGLLFPRSSVTKYSLMLKNSVGVLDSGYRGEISARFQYLWQPQDFTIDDGRIVGRIDGNKIYKMGDRVIQLLIFRTLNDAELELVTDKSLLSKTARGAGGYGSSGA